MAQPITFQTIIASLPAPAKKAYEELSAKWTSFGNTLVQWSNTHLRQEAAQKVQAVWNGIPHALVVMLTPPSVIIPVLAGYYIVHLVIGPFDQETLSSMWNGFSVGAFCTAAFQAIGFLSSFNPLYILSTLVYGYAAKFFASQGTLLD